jgi:hypothetical protein
VGLKMTVDFPRSFDLARPDYLTHHAALTVSGPGGLAGDEEWIVVAMEMTSSKGHNQQATLLKAVNLQVIGGTLKPQYNESEGTKDSVLYSRGFVIAGVFFTIKSTREGLENKLFIAGILLLKGSL